MGRSTGSDWLARYSGGEYEAVWAEMLQLGEALVSAPAYEHARAVAEETMRRARANVELLIERLQAAGYEFQYPEAVHVRPTVAEIVASTRSKASWARFRSRSEPSTRSSEASI
jgi:hypothetical protein